MVIKTDLSFKFMMFLPRSQFPVLSFLLKSIIKKTGILVCILSILSMSGLGASESEEVVTEQPRRLKINLNVSAPEDVQVREGESINKGDIVSDRIRVRRQLESQLQQTKLSLQRIKESKVFAPVSPLPTPLIQELPPANFEQYLTKRRIALLEYEKAQRLYQTKLGIDPFTTIRPEVEEAKLKLEQARETVTRQQEKIKAISQLPQLPPEVLSHEQYLLQEKENQLALQTTEWHSLQTRLTEVEQNRKLEIQQLQDDLNLKKANLTLAEANLKQAKHERSLLEYHHALTVSRRIEEANQAQIAHNRSLQEYQQLLRDKEFQVNQLVNQINVLEDKLNDIAVVRSPYDGIIRKIKYDEQHDNTMRVEITLMALDEDEL